ncbi:MAG: transporter [Acidobacteriota bacterium]
MTTRTGLAFALLLFVGGSAIAADAAQDVIEPDRPDLTTGSHLVAPGIVQFEVGFLYTRPFEGRRVSGSPITLRIGLRDWLEARAGFDGLLVAADAGGRTTGIGNVQLGAKIRIWPDSQGQGRLSVNPQLTLGTASPEKGFGSGQSDFAIAALFGFDLGPRGHLDLNYGVGAIGSGEGDARFVQHLVSASASVSVGERWNPYFEMFRISRESPDGAPNVSINTGVLYVLKPRLALDGGMAFGVSDDAPAFAAFGGFSIALGGSSSTAQQTKPLRTARTTSLTRPAAGRRGYAPGHRFPVE